MGVKVDFNIKVCCPYGIEFLILFHEKKNAKTEMF